MTPIPEATVVNWWMLALAIVVVVLVVVVVLLELIARTAARILSAVAAIWTGGTHIAANTVTIALLQRTNHLAGALLTAAGGIAAAAARIRRATGGAGA